ncbi:lysine transporter LysE [Streptomyces sp. SJL17-1]|uniref:lysine transporter LysE n=1 Tax=Streptomyces sp. SJL17-1 TaxID=2967223 RepID=UPI0029666998|nr:lysine transporter LysE [Streptomyces sp. SJL17-1]
MDVVRRALRGAGNLLVDLVGDAVAEVVLTLLALALLGGLGFVACLSWSFSPGLTLVGATLLSLLLAHGAWARFRDRARAGRGRRLAAVTSAFFTVTAVTAVFLLLYGTG